MLKKVAKYIHYVMIKIHNVKKIQKIHNVHEKIHNVHEKIHNVHEKIHNVHEKIHIVINVQIYYD